MQFGLLFECQRPYVGTEIDWNSLYKETLAQCELADQVGFDNVWFVEHHFLTGFSGSPAQDAIFGALSRVTKNIRIGYGVCILPYHHPVRVAERVALVDQLTDGRVEFGTGRSNAYEQMGLGVDPRNTRSLWEESITMLPANLAVRRVRMGGRALAGAQAAGFAQAGTAASPAHVSGLHPAGQLPAGRGKGPGRPVLRLLRHLGAGRAGQDLPGGPEERESGGRLRHRVLGQQRPRLLRQGQRRGQGTGGPVHEDLLRSRTSPTSPAALAPTRNCWRPGAASPTTFRRTLAAGCASPTRPTGPRPRSRVSPWMPAPVPPGLPLPSWTPTPWPTGASSSPATRTVAPPPSRCTRTSAWTR